MKEEFKKAGIPSAAVYSGSEDDRSQSLEALKNGELQVIFSVDMFNEGVDIPNVDAVLMLRPTQSPTIFLQQLGRGLRKTPGKAYLTVLDFIGNYRNANRIPAFLEGSTASSASPMHIGAPVDCLIDFDLRLLDLFEEMERNASRIRFEPRFLEEYSRIKKLKHHRPTRMDLFEELDEPVLQAASRRGSKNPLHNYLKFLHDHDLLDSQEEQSLWNSPARALIELLESTKMSQLYKVPVLSSFLESGRIQTALTKEQLLKSWKEFFGRDENWKDFLGMKSRGKIRSYQDFLAVSDQKHLSNILNNPVHFLIQSSNGLFVNGEGNQVIRLNLDLSSIDEALLTEQWKDILEFRTIEYRRNRFEKRT